MAPERLTFAALFLRRRLLRYILPAFLAPLIAGCSAGTINTADKGPSFSPFSGWVAFYRGPLDHLSAVRRGQCPMYPSCSEYAREAVARHGELVGWIMASDRLMRCGRDETRLSPKVKINGEWRYYDPVEQNDFWWNDAASRAECRENRPYISDR